MGAYLRKALQAGLSEERFWRSTPFVVQAFINEAGRAKMITGWMAERFAREKVLQSLEHYLNPKATDADDGDALIASWGLMHGLKVDDLGGEDDAT